MEMANMSMPDLFHKWIQDGQLTEGDICKTDDGFYAVRKNIPQVGSEYLYAVPGRKGYVYGVFAMNDQNTDEPGVCISFAQLDEKTMKLSAAPNSTIKAYFSRSQSQGAYLIARLYIHRIVSKDRHIQLPRYYADIYHGGNYRIPRFIEINNEDAVHTVCDQETIYIRDLDSVSGFEKLAILATHTGCTSFHSFAAGVQYHARPFGKESAAKLTASGETSPYHLGDSKWVKSQKKYHENV